VARPRRAGSGRALVANSGSCVARVTAGLEAEAAKVPEARFEQIWDEIDRALDRETAAPTRRRSRAPSLWSRMLGVLRPVWVPVAATAGVAAVVVGVLGSAGDHPHLGRGSARSWPANEARGPAPVLADSAVVDVEPVVPAPALGEAEIERIEFGGKAGRIGTIEGKRGTTTVIWISEDEPRAAGRSL
jgi:hypothetical protein